MDKKKIYIGNRTYTVEIADTEELQKKGLQGRDYLAPDEGMLFVYPEEQHSVEYWMKDTKIPLDQIAINDDDEEETNSEYKALLGSWQMSEQDGDVLVTSSFIFNSNGTYSFTYAENGDSDEVYTGKFTYDANSHKITRYEGNSNIIYEEYFIAEVNSTTLRLQKWSWHENNRNIYWTYTKK